MKYIAGLECGGACRYVELFRNISSAIVQVQLPTADPLAGFWGPSLLAHDLFPFPEASGTGFFVSGLAWGVRRGILDVRLFIHFSPLLHSL